MWLLWHTARVQDDHVAALADVPQAWRDWAPRLDLPLDLADFGYGHTDAQVDAVRVDDLALLDATTRPCTGSPCSTSAGSTRPRWTASSTSTGTRR